MIETLLLEGGELPAMLLLGHRPRPRSRQLRCRARGRSRPAISSSARSRAAMSGYSGQIVRPAVLGRAIARLSRGVRIVVRAASTTCSPRFRRARASWAWCAFREDAVARHGRAGVRAALSADARARARRRGAGRAQRRGCSQGADDVQLEPGMVFVLKPRVRCGGDRGAGRRHGGGGRGRRPPPRPRAALDPGKCRWA